MDETPSTNATNPETAQPSPAPAPAPADDLKSRLDAFIDTDVRPFLQQDGGDIELLGVEDGIVKVHLQGACGTCPSSIMTLQFGVERRLKEVFPGEVKGLELQSPLMGGMGGHGHHGGPPHPSHY
ncbi:NifU family protein [bacterium]|nr:NifU family protein [bacterium]